MYNIYMDETEELKRKIETLNDAISNLEKKVNDLYSGTGFPVEVEQTLVKRGFLKNYQTLIFNNASGDEFKVLLIDHNNDRTALGGDFITRYVPYTVDPSTDTFTSVNNVLADTQQVIPYSSGAALPSPLASGVIYWVRDASANTFKLSATSGGAAVNITTKGTGVQYISKV